MARPQKPAARKKSVLMSVRLLPSQKASLEDLTERISRKSGFSLSRAAVLSRIIDLGLETIENDYPDSKALPLHDPSLRGRKRFSSSTTSPASHPKDRKKDAPEFGEKDIQDLWSQINPAVHQALLKNSKEKS